MTDHEERANYLAGESSGRGLRPDERAALDRIAHQLTDEGMWEAPASDGQFRLLAAASQESRASLDRADQLDVTVTPATVPRIDVTPPRGVDGDGVIHSGDRRQRRRQRTAWFGAGAVVAAAAAAIALVATGRLDSVLDTGSNSGLGDSTIGSELAVSATYELTATDLDPDAVGSVDVVPTPAGVEFRLQLKGLDNREGSDYYTAWLVGPDELIPLGSFHWRKGGVEIVLWSGVDDPAYNRFTVTRQTKGDGGMSSGEVVLAGAVPDLTGGG